MYGSACTEHGGRSLAVVNASLSLQMEPKYCLAMALAATAALAGQKG